MTKYSYINITNNIIKDKKFIICDVDNTVCDSCTIIEDSIANNIKRLTDLGYTFGFMSGTDNNELIKLVGEPLIKLNITNFLLLGNTGSQAITFNFLDGLKTLYSVGTIPENDKNNILSCLTLVINKFKLENKSNKDDQILDRQTQITLSCIGRMAPKELKNNFDPTGVIRTEICTFLKPLLPQNYTAKIGGTTSVDILATNFDKGKGLKLFMETFSISNDKILFFGDSFTPQGNDYPALSVVDCVEVTNPKQFNECLEKIKGS